MNWQPVCTTFGDWHWYSPYLSKGWRAAVSDTSQSCAPRRPTEYTASAICKFWIVTHPHKFSTLAEAKTVALELALMQKQASEDPACRVEIQPTGESK